MKRAALILSVVMVFVLSLFAGAYAEEASLTLHLPALKQSQPADEEAVPLERIEVAKGSSVKLEYTAEGTDEWGKITKKVWATSDKTIAAVSNGSISGKNLGEAVITLTLTYKNGQELTASMPVEVFAPVKSLKLDQKKLTIAVGEEPKPLAVTITPADAKYQTVTWTSSDPSVAAVDEKGNVTGVGGGKATITASSDQPANAKGKKVSVSCSVTVTQTSDTVKLDKQTATLAKGSSMKLTADVLPAGTTNKKVTWSSSDPAIATVANGKVTAKSVGTVTITATAADGSGASASCEFTIVQAVKSVKLSKTKRIVVFVDKSEYVSATVSPADATNKRVTWKSSDPSVATVDEVGKITGRRAGTATITATAADGSGKSSSVKVVVEPKSPVLLESIGRGTYLPNLLALTVRNLTSTKTIKDFDFSLTLYSYSGSIINSGSYSLGKDTTIGPGKTKTIKRTSSGVGYATKFEVTITGVQFSDGSFYSIPMESRQTWTFRFN